MIEYVGIDVSKQRLDVQLGQQFFQVTNDETGLKKLVRALKRYTQSNDCELLVVCEASGGYEKFLIKHLQVEDYACHRAHANKVRAFAKSKGYLAKTDKIDAKVIGEYGHVMQVKADGPGVSGSVEKLGDLLKRRAQLLEDKKRESNRLEKATTAVAKRSIKSHIRWIEKAIKALEKEIETVRASSDEIQKAIELFSSIPGIGKLTASYLIAFLPELGRINAKRISALVGVAPFNRDSGQYKGKRFIQGGRKIVREILYMAALVSTRWNADLKLFYERLRSKGKAAKVALLAVARKLLMMLHSVAKRQSCWQKQLPLFA